MKSIFNNFLLKSVIGMVAVAAAGLAYAIAFTLYHVVF